MSIVKFFSLFAIVLFLIPLFPVFRASPAYACTCTRPPSPLSASASATAVFAGRVSTIDDRPGKVEHFDNRRLLEEHPRQWEQLLERQHPELVRLQEEQRRELEKLLTEKRGDQIERRDADEKVTVDAIDMEPFWQRLLRTSNRYISEEQRLLSKGRNIRLFSAEQRGESEKLLEDQRGQMERFLKEQYSGSKERRKEDARLSGYPVDAGSILGRQSRILMERFMLEQHRLLRKQSLRRDRLLQKQAWEEIGERRLGQGDVEVTFDVLQSWKGPAEETITLFTKKFGSRCGYGFKPGGEYLVYAGGKDNSLSTSLCSRTRGLARASEDLSVLGEGVFPWVPPTPRAEPTAVAPSLPSPEPIANTPTVNPGGAEGLALIGSATSKFEEGGSEELPRVTPSPTQKSDALEKNRAGGCLAAPRSLAGIGLVSVLLLPLGFVSRRMVSRIRHKF